MNQKLQRIFIYPADIKILEKVSTRTSYNRYHQLKDSLGKQPHQKVSITEYCKYYGIDEKTVVEKIS